MVTNLISLLTFFEETVGQGIGPNGTSGATVSTGAQWEAAELAGTAFQMPHLQSSISVDSVTETELEPEFVRQRFFQTQPTTPGLSNVTFGFSSNLTGRGATLAAGVTATATRLGRGLLNALGGVHYTETVTLAGGGHTTTVINVDDVSTLAVGACIAPVDPSTGLGHPRVITAIADPAVTLDAALPFTPADADVALGGETYFIDEDVIGDTSSNSGSTLSGVYQNGSNGSAGWEINGIKLGLTGIQFERNGFPSLEFSATAARFSDPSVGPDPTMPTVAFPTPPPMGPDSSIIIEDAGTTSLTTVCNGTVSVDPGVPVTPLECMADNLGDMEGYGLYSTTPAATTIEVDIFPRDNQWFTDNAANTDKKLSVIKHGSSGNLYGFFAQTCEIQNVAPGSGDFTSSNLTLRAVEHNATTATTALERSKFRIFLG